MKDHDFVVCNSKEEYQKMVKENVFGDCLWPEDGYGECCSPKDWTPPFQKGKLKIYNDDGFLSWEEV